MANPVSSTSEVLLYRIANMDCSNAKGSELASEKFKELLQCGLQQGKINNRNKTPDTCLIEVIRYNR
jgi:hypothetical protein